MGCKDLVSVSELRQRGWWRDLLGELIATFLLVSVQCALPLSWGTPGLGTGVHTALGMGFVVTGTVWSMQEFGGVHMNPAVTFSMLLARNITLLRGVVYIMIQCAGGIAGAALVYGVTPEKYRGTLAATQLNADMSVWQGILVEIWLTFNLVLTIHGSTYKGRKQNTWMFSIPIGMAVSVGVLCGFASTGASMNPARSLGPAVMMGLWEHHWIYWLGPFAGSALATLAYYVRLDLPDKNSSSAEYEVRPTDQNGMKISTISQHGTSSKEEVNYGYVADDVTDSM